MLPWGKYEYQKLSMGLCKSAYIFQTKMIAPDGLENIRIYIDDLLIISNKSFEDRINKLDKVLSKLKQKCLKANAEIPFFTRNGLQYLGFRITGQGIIPLPDLVEAIKNIAVPTTKVQ